MKKSKYTDSQILGALKRAEAGLAVPDLPGLGHKHSDLLHIWTAPNGKRKLTDTEVDCVHISGVRASPSAQLEFRACRPQQLEGLKGRYKSQVPCSPGSTGVPLVNSSMHRW